MTRDTQSIRGLGNSRPAVSVILPLNDGERTIGEALRSIVDQTFADWEAVVIDDGSRDAGAGIAEAFAAREGRISVVRRSNQGLASARNAGIELARGGHLHFLDCDDRLIPDGLARLIAAACRTGAAYGGSRWIDESGRSMGWSFAPSCPVVGLEQLIEFNRWTPGGQLLRRDLLGDIRFDAAATGAEDHDLWLRLGGRGVRWTAVEGDVVEYRQRPSSMSRDHARMAHGRRVALDRALNGSVPAGDIRTRILLESALAESAARAWSDDSPRRSRTLALLRDNSPCVAVSPEQAARAAHWSLPHGACLAPGAWTEDRTAGPLFRAACEWWRALEGSSFGSPGLAERARAALAGMIVPPERIAERIVRLITPDGPVVLLGLGNHAAVAARALAGAGLAFTGYDDACRPGEEVCIGGVRVAVSSAAEAFNVSVTHILTPWKDDALLARVPRGAGRVRWRVVAAELGRFELARLDRLVREPSRPTREAA